MSDETGTFTMHKPRSGVSVELYRASLARLDDFIGEFRDWLVEYRPELDSAPWHVEDLVANVVPALEGFAAGWAACAKQMNRSLQDKLRVSDAPQ